jgi:UDP-N-acetylglucosamine 2-epimerase (non-hydrolysing)/GDP/UDP-N,N'-diacetylbacillosamine 2-epimerase (hydrolysing)
MTLRICVVTGTRADYGLLAPVIDALKGDEAFKVQIAVTGMHLSPEFGLTYREIEADGHAIDAKVEMLLSSDTAVGAAKSTGLGIVGFSDVFDRLSPDMVMMLGDRFEAMAAAIAALTARIPVAHLSGGDVTEGAFDEAMRHSITKMAHLHFVASASAAKRVRQLGEDPARIHHVGDPGLDRVRTMTLMTRAEVEAALGFKLRRRNLLVTFHPATLDATPSMVQFEELLAALAALPEDVGLVFTRPNADPEGRALIRRLDEFLVGRANAVARASLGHKLYLATMAQCDAVVGNSSSGLLEAPSLGKPSVNVGGRQDGRLRAASVADCDPHRRTIAIAIESCWDKDWRGVDNPYGDGHAAERIVCVLKTLSDPPMLLKKRFHDLP